MKKLSLALPLLLSVVPLAAQNQTRPRFASSIRRTKDSRPAARDRRVSTNQPTNGESPAINMPKPIWGDSAIVPEAADPTATEAAVPATTNVGENGPLPPRYVKLTSLGINPAASPDLRSAHAAGPTQVYRVGVGDVLDIRLTNMTTRESTLFTVMNNGLLEYPLLEAPTPVVGLTPDEVARRLSTEIRVLQNPRVSVNVRDYASHTVFIGGAVDNPGRKVLRREAMPLFALLADASPRTDATTATLNRYGKETRLSLADNKDLSTLIMSGDIVKISEPAKQFIYVGGDVASPGEKDFRSGMTLTQALLASGGARTSRATIAKRGSDGLLSTRVYDLQQISEGKAPDPILEAGDRIEVKPAL